MLAKPKLIPGFGIAVGLCVWVFTHLTESIQQGLAYTAVVAVILLIAWAYWKTNRQLSAGPSEREPKPPDQS
jgi:cyanate permease